MSMISDSQQPFSLIIPKQYGVALGAKSTTDIAFLNKLIWGKASTDIAGWATTVSADVDGSDLGSGLCHLYFRIVQ